MVQVCCICVQFFLKFGAYKSAFRILPTIATNVNKICKEETPCWIRWDSSLFHTKLSQLYAAKTITDTGTVLY